ARTFIRPSFPTRRSSDLSAFRWHALTALATMTHVAALDGLSDLLHVPSVETRYGAFRAMRIRNPGDPMTRGETLDKKFRTGFRRDRKSTRLNSSHVATSY